MSFKHSDSWALIRNLADRGDKVAKALVVLMDTPSDIEALATAIAGGLMSASDKAKLDGLTSTPIGHQEATVNSPDATTSSTNYVALTGMSLTIAATGTYLLLHEAIYQNSNQNALVYASFFVNGVQVASTERHLQSNGDQNFSINAVQSLTQGDVLTVQWKVGSGAGTCHDRSMHIVRLS